MAGSMHYFGDARWCAGMPIIKPPVGLVCFECDEPIASTDCGVTAPFVSVAEREIERLDDTGALGLVARGAALLTVASHKECFLRHVVGSVGHQLRRCPCHGGTMEDPPGLTRRQAASAACRLAFVLERLNPRKKGTDRPPPAACSATTRNSAAERRDEEARAKVDATVSEDFPSDELLEAVFGRPIEVQPRTGPIDCCPSCDAPIEVTTCARGNDGPGDGDWSVCLACSMVLRYESTDSTLRLRPSTLAERSGPDVPDGLEQLVQAAMARGKNRPTRAKGNA